MTAPELRLYGYWRSTAAWRVRIALNLKGLAHESVAVHLRRGAQRDPAYLAQNPQGLLPMLVSGDLRLTQSLAIVEWLDERFPEPPLLPEDPDARAAVRGFAQVIACDTHPIQNLRVLARLRHAHGQDEAAVQGWARHWIAEGLAACEALLPPGPGPYAFGDAPGLADLCLVPQLYNARRFGADLAALPRLGAVEAACAAHPAFAAADPARQPDAET
jgi:maleylpyruvate isomerase